MTSADKAIVTETLAEEFARLTAEYLEEGSDDTRPEAWNLLADFAVENASAITAALNVQPPLKLLDFHGHVAVQSKKIETNQTL